MNDGKNRVTLKVLLCPGALEDVHLAVCLEHYIVAHGKSPEEAFLELQRMLVAEVAYGIRNGPAGNPLASIPKAPDEYWRKFRKAGVYEIARAAPITIKMTSADGWEVEASASPPAVEARQAA